jgi:hypothetical protein
MLGIGCLECVGRQMLGIIKSQREICGGGGWVRRVIGYGEGGGWGWACGVRVGGSMGGRGEWGGKGSRDGWERCGNVGRGGNGGSGGGVMGGRSLGRGRLAHGPDFI